MISSANQQPAQFQSASLYVGDLLPDVTEGLLYEQFNKVGPVASIRVCRDVTSRQSLGYAYVNFHNAQDAERALDTMNFTDIKSKPCRIMWSQRDPSLRKSGVGNIFVKNLSPKVDNKGLYDVFSVFGNILSCKVATDIQTGISKGYGYVHYETAEAARDAIIKINGNLIEDVEVKVDHFVPRNNRPNHHEWTNVYISQIPPHWDDLRLKDVTSVFGPIQNAVVMRDGQGNNRGFGFVNFNSHESAALCVSELPKQEFEGGAHMNATQALNRDELRKSQFRNTKFQGMNLYVKNLDDQMTNESLVTLFSKFGEIKSARIMREGPNFSGPSKGFGFVCFKNPDAATVAMNSMNNQIVGNKPIFVTYYQTKDERKNYLANLHSHRVRGNNGNAPGGMYNQQPAMPMPFPMYLQAPNLYRAPYASYGQGGGRMNTQPRSPGGYPRQPVPYYQMPYGMAQMPMQGGPPQQQPSHMMMNKPYNKNPRMQGNPSNISRNPSTQGPSNPRPQGQQPPRQVQQIAPQPQAPQPIPTPSPVVTTAGPVGSVSYAQNLASLDPQEQKNSLGESLYPLIYSKKPHLAGKITGMLLEMDNAELVNLLESPDALNQKVDEALAVLRSHGIQ